MAALAQFREHVAALRIPHRQEGIEQPRCGGDADDGDGWSRYYACAEPGFKDNTGPGAGAPIRAHRWVKNC